MKRILLTSTAMVAFAGAAAADISLSGEASFTYNDMDGYSHGVSITATGTAELDSGYTASASLTLEDADTVTGGDISIASDTASLTYHIAGDGTGAAHVGDNLGKMSSTLTAIFGDDTATASDLTASVELGGATVRASLDGSAYELGVSTDLGGTALNLGFTEAGDFGVTLGGSSAAVDYTLAFASDDAYGLAASTTAGGADLSLAFGEDGWEIGASMPLGAATVGVTLDDTSSWEVSVDTSLEGVDLGFTFDDASAWTMTAGVSAGDVSVDFATDSASVWSLDAAYDLGNGIAAGAGVNSADDQYVEVNYDLGGGAAAAITYGNVATDDAGPDEDILEGTTIEVSFSF